MKKIVSGLVSTVFVIALVLGVAWYFWGTTTVVSFVDGQEVAGAEVFVGGESVGFTPYQARLGFGHHKITITPPPNVAVKEAHVDWHMFTLLRGDAVEARFESRPKSVQVPVACQIEGEEVGDCQVFMDGEPAGKTPIDISMPTTGEHAIRVKPPEGIQTKEDSQVWKLQGEAVRQLTASFSLR